MEFDGGQGVLGTETYYRKTFVGVSSMNRKQNVI